MICSPIPSVILDLGIFTSREGKLTLLTPLHFWLSSKLPHGLLFLDDITNGADVTRIVICLSHHRGKHCGGVGESLPSLCT